MLRKVFKTGVTNLTRASAMPSELFACRFSQ